jgi:hypothetical protein
MVWVLQKCSFFSRRTNVTTAASATIILLVSRHFTTGGGHNIIDVWPQDTVTVVKMIKSKKYKNQTF